MDCSIRNPAPPPVSTSAARPGGSPDSATNSGPLAQTIKPVAAPDTGDQDARDLPSNGAIPDEVKGLIADRNYHVP